MRPSEYAGTFAVIAVVILVIELLAGDSLSGWVVVLALCVAAGGTLGVAFRRNKALKR